MESRRRTFAYAVTIPFALVLAFPFLWIAITVGWILYFLVKRKNSGGPPSI